MKSRWKDYLQYGSIFILGGLFVFLTYETYKSKNMGFETKTYWDWMELLIIPLVLAIGAFFLNRSERALERQIAEDRRKEDRKLADDRAQLEREIATDRQQEAALQSYLDRMADLLLKDKLRIARNEEVRNVARTRTLTVLRGLDSTRKGLILRFLQEAQLISNEKTIVNLEDADLREASLSVANLYNANLYKVDLYKADLSNADLRNADLHNANLGIANLRSANLSHANLSNADISRTNMLMTNLSHANLRDSSLTTADLRDTDLRGADLKGADLTYANLRGAKVTEEQLATA